MNCAETQLELSAENAVDKPRANTEARRHLSACSACASYVANAERLETLAQNWRAEQPNAALESRIRAAVSGSELITAAPKLRISSSRLRFALAAASCLIVATALLTARSFTGAKSSGVLADVAAAMAHIGNVHITEYTTDYITSDNTVPHHFDTLQKVEEQWYLPGTGWRKEGVWGSRLIVRGSGSGHPLT